MTLRGRPLSNQRSVWNKTIELQLAGKTEAEVAETLGITRSTVQYLASMFAPTTKEKNAEGDQRPRLAYELWSAGKSFAEIGRILNISHPKAHQLVHRYQWNLRRLKE
jgi:DNA-binding CsgD family transcriptional regulator